MQDATIREIEQFLYREARLLDNRQYHAWLDLFTDDVRYWMPVRTSRYAKISKSVVLLDEAGYDETDIATEHEQAIMDEDKASLTQTQPVFSNRKSVTPRNI
jgi:3-phenylpropionate/cinnamic acid dioxygenase small subunit